MAPSALEGGLPDVVRVEQGETIIEQLRPHWLMIFLRRPMAWVALVACSVAAWFEPWGLLPGWASWVGPLALLGWEILEWQSRSFLLTDRRVMGEGGVLRRVLVDVRLGNVQHAALQQTLLERLLALGTVGFASSGTGGYDVVWTFLAHPDRVLERVRDQLDHRDASLDARS